MFYGYDAGWVPLEDADGEEHGPLLATLQGSPYPAGSDVRYALLGSQLAVETVDLLGSTWACVGSVPVACEADLLSMIGRELEHQRLKETVRQQQALIDASNWQLARDFEEMTWIRRFSHQLVLQEIEDGLSTGVREYLELLRTHVSARSLIICLNPQAGRAAPPRVCLGKPPAPRTIEELMSERKGCRTTGTVIRNWPRETAPVHMNGYMATRIAVRGRHLGWMFAIHREHLAGCCDGNASEFGSPDASLLESAATLLATHLSNLALMDEKQAMLIGTIRCMINSIDAKDAYTCGHSDRVAQLARLIARNMGLADEECERIYVSGLLHDVGKIGVPDDVLTKPGKLTPEEFEMVQKHPEIGAAILKHLTHLQPVVPGVLHHHESWDGTGYPHRLSGEAIPLMARVLAVADAFDAMTSNRPYRAGMPFAKAESILLAGSGQQWDPACVQALMSCLDEAHAMCAENPAAVPPWNRDGLEETTVTRLLAGVER